MDVGRRIRTCLLELAAPYIKGTPAAGAVAAYAQAYVDAIDWEQQHGGNWLQEHGVDIAGQALQGCDAFTQWTDGRIPMYPVAQGILNAAACIAGSLSGHFGFDPGSPVKKPVVSEMTGSYVSATLRGNANYGVQ